LLFVFVRKRNAPTGEMSEVRGSSPRHLWCLGPVDLKVAGPRSSPWGRPETPVIARYRWSITNSRVTGYRTAKPSDSPPRPSRYALSHACRPTHPSVLGAEPHAIRRGQARRRLDARRAPSRRSGRTSVASGDEGAAVAQKDPAAGNAPRHHLGSLRRSLHGSGRSAASRHPFLSLSARCLGGWGCTGWRSHWVPRL
jgi:hypothetical protein